MGAGTRFLTIFNSYCLLFYALAIDKCMVLENGSCSKGESSLDITRLGRTINASQPPA